MAQRPRRTQRRPPNSHEVARIAGVSRSAVSRTFTEGASVSKATRARVLKAAQKLNYRPNPLARSLKTGRSHVLGLAVTRLDNQLYPQFVQRLCEEFSKLGYRLLLFITHGIEGPDPMIEELLRFRLDALILASSTTSSRLAEECREAGVPVIMFRNVNPASDVTSLTCANVAGARTVAEFLVAAGHKRFGFISGLEAESTTFEREAGFRSYLHEHHLSEPLRAPGFFSFDGAAQAARTLLKHKKPPDAIFCANDHMAFAALQVARYELGLQPGKDISIVGFENVPISGWPCFSLTTFAEPTELLVTRTIALVTRSLEQDMPRGVHECYPGELIVRGSARLPKAGLVRGFDGSLTWRSKA